MMMPLVSATESDQASERTKLREFLEQQLSAIQDPDGDPPQPLIILRMLLWIKNLILLLITAPIWVTILMKLINITG